MDLIWIIVGIIVGIMLVISVVFCWLFCCFCAACCSSELSESSPNRPSLSRLEFPSPSPSPVSTPSWQGRQTHSVDDDIYIIRPQPRPSQPTPESRPQYVVETERIFHQRTIVHKPRSEVRQPRLQVQHLVEDETPNRSEFERQQADEYAKNLAEKKNEFMRLLEKHRQAYEQQQQQAEAKRCSIEANKIEDNMIACNSRAAQAEIIFQKKNPSRRSVNFIDLHGLYVKEAIVKLKKRIDLVRKRGSPHLTVCVGQGNHSQGEPKLKPAVMQFARKANIYYKVDSPNRGCIRLFFDEE